MKQKITVASLLALLLILSSTLTAYAVTWNAVTTITEETETGMQSYTSTNADENALLVDTPENVSIIRSEFLKVGGTYVSDNMEEYGTNSAVVCKQGTTTIKDSTIDTGAPGANGMFILDGEGNLHNTTVTTSGESSNGVVNKGGETNILLSNITTTGKNSSAVKIHGKSGDGLIYKSNFTTKGANSPVALIDGYINIRETSFTGEKSEAVRLISDGTIMQDCSLSSDENTVVLKANDTSDNLTFIMKGGNLSSKKSAIYVKDSTASINLLETDIDTDILMTVEGSAGQSGTLIVQDQALVGSVIADTDAMAVVAVGDNSSWEGSASGKTVIVMKGGTLKLTKDTNVGYIYGTGTIDYNGHKLYQEGQQITGDIIRDEDDNIHTEIKELHSVSYEYSGTLPDAVKETLPEETEKYVNETVITPKNPTSTSVKVGHTTYTFNGWDAETKTVNGNIKFTGSWTEAEETSYNASYAYTGNLPEEVQNTLPQDTTHYYTGDTVTAKTPTETSINVNHVIYTFEGWDTKRKTIENSNVTFTGSWSTEPEPSYTVTYKYTDKYSGTLPDEVLTTLPIDNEPHYTGEEVTPKTPTPNSIEVNGITYTFRSWDTEKKTVDGNVVFTGRWIKSEEKTYSVYYHCPDTLPDDVQALTPVDNEKYYAGDIVIAKTPDPTEIYIDGIKYYWTNWDAKSKIVENQDVNFYGGWACSLVGQEHDVYYEYSGELPAEVTATLPDKGRCYHNKTTVYPEAPSQTTVKVNHKTYTFNGWDAESKYVDGSDITFTGTWSVEEETSYKAIYTYTGNMPADVQITLPSDTTDYYKGDTVTAKSPTKTSVNVNHTIYTFEDWDADNKTVGTDNVTFTGSWTTAPEPSYSVNYQYTGDLPTAVLNTLPTDTETHYAGDVVAPKQPTQTTVTANQKIYTFNGWDAQSKTITGNTTFTGSWTAHSETSYVATYEYTGNLPDEVLATLPTDSASYYTGETVSAKNPLSATVDVGLVRYTFNGWDSNSKTVNNSNVKFTGTWSKKYGVAYVYDESLPQAVWNTIPTDNDRYNSGEMASPKNPTQTNVTVNGIKYVFDKWTPTRVTVNNTATFTGHWKTSIETANVVVGDATYTGSRQTPSITVTLGGKTLTKNTDYTVGYQNNIEVGTAIVNIIGTGNYTGTVTAHFTIKKMKIPVPSGKNFTYDGKNHTGVIGSEHYRLSGTYAATDAGEYDGIATLKNNYMWSDGTDTPKTIKWKIAPLEITSARAPDQTYTGQELQPKLTVKAGDMDATYRAFYLYNIDVGKATVFVEGTKNFTGKIRCSFTIHPKEIQDLKPVKKFKLSKGKKKITAKWKKMKAAGYQIQYSTSRNFSDAKTIYAGKKASKKIIKKLAGKKRYYIRIRNYQDGENIVHVSAWKTKSAKTKK